MYQNIKNREDMILGIKSILSKHRCSFSEEEQVLLNDCIDMLEQSTAKPGTVENAFLVVKIVQNMVRIFSIYDHLKDLF